MRTHRFAIAAVSAALIATPLVATSPAHAASPTINVTIRPSISLSVATTKGNVGDFQDVSATLSFVDPVDHTTQYLEVGTSALQQLLGGTSAWRNVQGVSNSGFADYSAVTKLTQNLSYRVVYGGGTYDDPTFDSSGTVYHITFPAVTSGSVKVNVMRKITEKTSKTGKGKKEKLYLSGTVGSWAKKKLVFQISTHSNKGFKKYKTVKTTSTGRYKVQLKTAAKSGKKLYFRFIVPGDAKFTGGYSDVFYTYKYVY